jgi:hypothetical protein
MVVSLIWSQPRRRTRQPRGVHVTWAIFEREARQYEGWYASRRGQRVDQAERHLLERLLFHFPTARSVFEEEICHYFW